MKYYFVTIVRDKFAGYKPQHYNTHFSVYVGLEVFDTHKVLCAIANQYNETSTYGLSICFRLEVSEEEFKSQSQTICIKIKNN